MDVEPPAAELAQQRFGKNRPRGVAGADEQHAEGLVGHGVVSGFGGGRGAGTDRAARGSNR
jgi:hypothetical protein